MIITIDVPVTVHCTKQIELDTSEYFNATNGEYDLDEDSVSQFILEELQNNGVSSDFGDKYEWEHEFFDACWPDRDEDIDINVDISDKDYEEWETYDVK